MRRDKRRDDIDGWIILDKPFGVSSARAVNRVKRLLNVKKAGHAGTLDPTASGMLPIALGQATKTVPFVMRASKSYRFCVKWGSETDTGDVCGIPIAYSDHKPSPEEVISVLSEFTGNIRQVPPVFSAVKVSGRRAYEIARDGGDVSLEPRTIYVHSLELMEVLGDSVFSFYCECSKGTYIRSLARDLGQRLGTRGHVVKLRRIRIGRFEEHDMVTLKALKEACSPEKEREEPASISEGEKKYKPSGCQAFLRPIVEGIRHSLPEIQIDHSAAERLRSGQMVKLMGQVPESMVGEAPEAYATCQGNLIALGALKEGCFFHPTRVFRDQSPT